MGERTHRAEQRVPAHVADSLNRSPLLRGHSGRYRGRWAGSVMNPCPYLIVGAMLLTGLLFHALEHRDKK